MNAWTVVLVAGAGSFLLRVGLVALVDHVTPPPWFERLAALVVPAAFAGIAASGLAAPVAAGGTEAMSILVAGIVTVGAARRGRSTPAAFAAGLLTLWATAALAALS